MGTNDMLSQEEIDALLNGGGSEAEPEKTEDAMVTPDVTENIEETTAVVEDNREITENIEEIDQTILDDMHKDAVGEIGNISMGSAATTLSLLLNQKVQITTPTITLTTLEKIRKEYPIPCLLVDVKYTQGLEGSNILMIEMSDAAIIADLMMGGDGTNCAQELNDIHLSAVSEAMNQMMGSTATSLSGMFNKKIDISPPEVKGINLGNVAEVVDTSITETVPVIKVSFRMEIGTLINSNIMQIIPVEFAKEMVSNLLGEMSSKTEQVIEEVKEVPRVEPDPVMPPPVASPPPQQQPQQPIYQQPVYQEPVQPVAPQRPPVQVQPVQFAPLVMQEQQDIPANIGLLMDVPLQITVELGRTKMPIKDILDLGIGSIIELDKLAGEPVNLLVNGKLIAKGEVVVIDENFGLRITDILSPAERMKTI